MPVNKPGILLASKTLTGGTPFRDGILCLSPQIFRYPVKSTGPFGTFTYGPGLVSTSLGFGPNGWILQGQTWNFQAFFRDPLGPCGQTANLSNVIQATFTP